MERFPPFYEEEDDDDEHHLHHQLQQEQHGLLSCWGKLKHVFPWRKLRRHVRRRHSRVPVKRGSFKYDPLSYAQNFDDGGKDEDEENLSSRGFSSRFVALNASTSIKQSGGG